MSPGLSFLLVSGALALTGAMHGVVGCGGGGPHAPDVATTRSQDGDPMQDAVRPLSGLVAVTCPAPPPGSAGAVHLPAYVRSLVDAWNAGTLPAGFEFPLAAASGDRVRVLPGLRHNVVARWLDPLTEDDGVDAPRFGANADFNAYFGDGWDAQPGDPPSWRGAGGAGWMWTNFEYVSNAGPTTTSAPTGQMLTLALWLRSRGVFTHDVRGTTWTTAQVDAFLAAQKAQVGGAWYRVAKDPVTEEWHVVTQGSAAQRYDATSRTLARLTGVTLNARDHDDAGVPLPPGVVAGIAGDCSGVVSPWGTVLTCEENVQDCYGDLEACWSSTNAFVAGAGFDPGLNVRPTFAPETATSAFGRSSIASTRHERDTLGYPVEIDPSAAPGTFYGSTGAGVGHRKFGSFGRARWESVTFVTDATWRLLPDRPVVVYGADDRRGGRVFKWVSTGVATAGMSRASARALLDAGTLYVAHFADLDNESGRRLRTTAAVPTVAAPGTGTWLRLSTASGDVAPNAATLGPGTTIGAALRDTSWNGIGGFPDDDAVRKSLFTACNKVGVRELNRPEDVEWNPADPSGTPRLYVAFTGHRGRTALDERGVLGGAASRADALGAVWALEEADPADPASSGTFTYFEVWGATSGTGAFDAANPDNLAIDRDGGVWFGTDGNVGTNGHADALYYLDLDPRHAGTASFGRAFRVAAGPGDSEATGPCFTSDMRTLFFSVQHPGEGSATVSTWPRGTP